MNLLAEDLFKKLPPLCSQKNLSVERKMIYAKFFFPIGNWTWFVMEGEKRSDDFLFFGYMIGLRERFGYFTLSELEGVRVEGLLIERDLYFQPGKFCDVIKKFRDDRRA